MRCIQELPNSALFSTESSYDNYFQMKCSHICIIHFLVLGVPQGRGWVPFRLGYCLQYFKEATANDRGVYRWVAL